MTRIEVSDLRVGFARPDGGSLLAVRGVDLAVGPGEAVGLVGESGCGKTSVVRALAGLLPSAATVTGSVRVDGAELVGAPERALRAVRGRRVAVVPQGGGLDPVTRVGRRLVETLRVVGGLGRSDARDRAVELVEEVGLAPDLLRRFPHQLSGGQRQRVVVALGLACGAGVLVADEPLSGLDARTQQGLLELLGHLRGTRGLGLLLVSHDLTGVLRHCGQVHVMYAGRIVESAVTDGFGGTHPYSRGLLGAVAGLAPASGWATIPGAAPALTAPPAGCVFAERCPVAAEPCGESEPALRAVETAEVACHRAGTVRIPAFPALTAPPTTTGTAREPVVRCRGVHVTLGTRRAPVVALGGVDVDVHGGEVVALAGESGSGKSTLARVLLGLVTPAGGTVEVDGVDLRTAGAARLRALRGRVGFVHQDPYGALHPGMRVRDLVGEPLAINGVPPADRAPRVRAALQAAGLSPDDVLDRFPGRLSGGQRQRVAIARAVVGEPVLLVCDEATSMLDASTRAGIARTVRSLADDRDLAVLFVTHDLGEAVHLCDRLIVLRHGEVVDSGVPRDVLRAPRSAFTRDMVAAFDGPDAPAVRRAGPA